TAVCLLFRGPKGESMKHVQGWSYRNHGSMKANRLRQNRRINLKNRAAIALSICVFDPLAASFVVKGNETHVDFMFFSFPFHRKPARTNKAHLACIGIFQRRTSKSFFFALKIVNSY